MLSRFFSSNWKPHTIVESSGSVGCALVLLRGLNCEQNVKTGQRRFIGEFGVFFADWIDSKWNDEGNSIYRMISGSPWRWRVEISDFKPFMIEVVYQSESSKRQMISDTLDAIIVALEKK